MSKSAKYVCFSFYFPTQNYASFVGIGQLPDPFGTRWKYREHIGGNLGAALRASSYEPNIDYVTPYNLEVVAGKTTISEAVPVPRDGEHDPGKGIYSAMGAYAEYVAAMNPTLNDPPRARLPVRQVLPDGQVRDFANIGQAAEAASVSRKTLQDLIFEGRLAGDGSFYCHGHQAA